MPSERFRRPGGRSRADEAVRPSRRAGDLWANRQVDCDDVADLLASIADGSGRAERRVQRHVESCLRCQAEVLQYRKLLRALHQLRTEVFEPAPGLLTSILAGIEAAGEHGAIRSLLSGRRAAYVGGVAVATAAAGAAGALVLVSRASRRRMNLAG
ncbi:MAG TPA: hypothetical protein VKQ71_13630 [Acidimicrobiales bacterium]|nr:hypothetical protein [Acidimicrobiales bacterium]